jgi:mono/diheme cytochrome c family protein
VLLLMLFIPFGASAQTPTEQGALAYERWYVSDAGGSDALPGGEDDSDYVRCKACHGWDWLGTDGGYARRSRNEGRSNAGFTDGDQTSRNISGGGITAEMILAAGTGRAFANGSGSWVDDDGTPAGAAAHQSGITLGNTHPDFFAPGGLVLAQAQNLATFLNDPDAAWDAYFDAIFPNPGDPQDAIDDAAKAAGTGNVLYVFKASADPANGEALYGVNCLGCHGDPAGESPIGSPDGGVAAFIVQDGKPSEFIHKVRWGSADTIMTREATGTLDAADTADILAYVMDVAGIFGFPFTGGHDGSWFGGLALNGEGFLFDIVDVGGVPGLVVYFFTFDPVTGEQVWIIAVGAIDFDTAVMDAFIAEGGIFGMGGGDLIPFGTITAMVSGCGSGMISWDANAAMEADGFMDGGYPIEKATDNSAAVVCP